MLDLWAEFLDTDELPCHGITRDGDTAEKLRGLMPVMRHLNNFLPAANQCRQSCRSNRTLKRMFLLTRVIG